MERSSGSLRLSPDVAHDQLSNPSSTLAAVLGATGVVHPGPKESRESIGAEPALGRLGNGVVQRAVVKVLEVARRPMSRREVRLAVEDLLGHPVSEHSISTCWLPVCAGGSHCSRGWRGDDKRCVGQRR